MADKTPETTVTPSDFLSNYGETDKDPVRKMWKKVLKFAEPLAELYKQIRESSPPTPTELDSELANSDDPQVVEFREELKRLELAIRTTREEAHKHILSGYHVSDPTELEKAKKAFNAAYDNVKSTIGTLKKFADVMELPDVIPAVDRVEFPSLRGLGRVYTATGTPMVRARVEGIRIVRKDGKEKSVKRFSEASLFLSMETTELITAWSKEAGVSDLKEISEVVTYETNGHTLTVTPLSEVQTEIDLDKDDE